MRAGETPMASAKERDKTRENKKERMHTLFFILLNKCIFRYFKGVGKTDDQSIY